MPYKPLTRESITEAVRIHDRVGREQESDPHLLDGLVTGILRNLKKKGFAEPRMGVIGNENVKMFFSTDYHPTLPEATYVISFHPNDCGLQPEVQELVKERLEKIQKALEKQNFPVLSPY